MAGHVARTFPDDVSELLDVQLWPRVVGFVRHDMVQGYRIKRPQAGCLPRDTMYQLETTPILSQMRIEHVP